MEKKFEKYVAPEVYVVECQVEKGYANSGDGDSISFGDPVDEASTRSVEAPDWWFK